MRYRNVRTMNIFLVFSGILSFITAALHIGCIIFGGSWYRFFGAGEQMAVLSEHGSVKPTVITSVIVLIFSIWALYAFSAAGLVGKLPFTRTALIVITYISVVALLGFSLLRILLEEVLSFGYGVQ